MPPRPPRSSGHLHKRRRPVSIVSSRESSLSPSRQSSFPHSITGNVTWGSNKAYLSYHEEEYARAVTIPHSHYRTTTDPFRNVQEDLYGVPVLADQVDFEPPLEGDEKHPYLMRIFRNDSKKKGTQRVSPPVPYPAELIGMTMDERQDLAAQGRRASNDAMDTDHETQQTHHRSHKAKKSVSWDPELGSTSSSGHPAHDPTSAENVFASTSNGEASSIASDKTAWPFPRKPRSPSDKRSHPQTPPSSQTHNPHPQTSDDTPQFTGFEFTPRTYVSLWDPSNPEQDPPLDLPTTPEPSPSRHRRTSSICHRFSKNPSTTQKPGPPPPFTDPQLSPSPFRATGGPSSWPTLPPFKSAKVYTPPSPFEHPITGFAQQQRFQAGLDGGGAGAAAEWKRVDFGAGGVGVTPSRTLQYAAADWLRTR